jgi:multidrug efflux pump subunit AcrA (membrane-fusion protein)
MVKSEKIMISINGELQEAQGEVLEQIKKDQTEQAILEAEYEAKKQARIDAITKLGQASGLTTTEIESILNI